MLCRMLITAAAISTRMNAHAVTSATCTAR
jgi:hypothetical protein